MSRSPQSAESSNGVILTVVVVASVLLLGATVFGALFDASGAERIATEGIQPLDGLSWQQIADAEGTNETVYQSRGNAIRLTGADDSYVKSKQEISIATDGNWTVCTWARVANSSASMTALSVDGRITLGYNGSAGNWTGWYYDDGSRSSWSVTANATNESERLHQLCLVRNDPQLGFYINASREDGVSNTSASNVADAPVSSTNWNGTLEETRTFDEPLNASQRNATVNEPNDPLKNATRTARMMYDAGEGNGVYIWWAGTNAELSNGTWVDGFPGEEMSRASLMGGDYKWAHEGPKIKPVSGGELDGAPVVYVDYQKTQAIHGVVELLGNSLEFASVIVILIVAKLIVGRTGGMSRR